MSGHSKWANIKNKKGATDAKRGKLFSKLSKNIRIAVKEGKSGDVNFNSMLRLAVDKARAANMPAENIKRAIDRGLGNGKGGQILEMSYEGYGPNGVGFLVLVATDNKMRTSSEIRSVFEKNGGSLGGPGAVSFLFELSPEKNYTVKIPIEISDDNVWSQLEALEEALLEDDDVEEVFHNAVRSS